MKPIHLLSVLLAMTIGVSAAEASAIDTGIVRNDRPSVDGSNGLVDNGFADRKAPPLTVAQQSNTETSESDPVGTIYYWTDDNGVRHFTNKSRPEDVENVGRRLEKARPAKTDQEARAETERTGIIYYWTDDNGVRHFTNKGRPEGVDNVGQRKEAVSPDPTGDLVIEKSQTKENAEDQNRQQVREARMERQVEAERQRLQDEIDKIDNLAIGVSFTQGMKDNRMRPFKEQLALLNEDPEKYFQMKRNGAFDN